MYTLVAIIWLYAIKVNDISGFTQEDDMGHTQNTEAKDEHFDKGSDEAVLDLCAMTSFSRHIRILYKASLLIDARMKEIC